MTFSNVLKALRLYQLCRPLCGKAPRLAGIVGWTVAGFSVLFGAVFCAVGYMALFGEASRPVGSEFFVALTFRMFVVLAAFLFACALIAASHDVLRERRAQRSLVPDRS